MADKKIEENTEKSKISGVPETSKKVSKQKHKISEKKIKAVKELAKLIDSKNTFLIASTLNLSSSQLQQIRKKLRNKAIFKFVKKNTALRAIEESKKEGIKETAKYVNESPALIISDEDPFEIAALLAENRYPARAKAGQLAKKEIVIEAGPTDLMPGPVLTELGAAGLKAGIVQGKVTVKERQVLARQGEIIPPAVASILMKLEMMPFSVELEPLAAFDSSTGKVYANLKIDKEGTLARLKEAFSSSFQFALKIGYTASETISQLLARAEREAISLDNLISTSTTNVQTTEEK